LSGYIALPVTFAPLRYPMTEWPATTLSGVHFRLLDDPVDPPVRTSFGVMHSRATLLVRLTDEDGMQGFGEIWCNFPEGGARYKATLMDRYVGPALRGQRFEQPEQVQAKLRSLFNVLRLQCADHGAIAQLCAGVDQAAWDLFCKRKGEAFWQLLGGRPEIAVYASSIGPQHVADTIRAQHAQGHTRFKIKLGFGDGIDEANLQAALGALQAEGELMVDVNQGWTLSQASRWLPHLSNAGVVWCEEPVPADTPWNEWRELAVLASMTRLAAGENLLGMSLFVEAVEQGRIGVLQPDLGKWGGISDNLELARRLPNAGAWICPHWLSGGIGLMASLQYKAGIGGPGCVEMDINPNRQRSEALVGRMSVKAGAVTLSDAAGLIPPLSEWLLEPERWQAAGVEVAHVA
jgi:D-galactarolactone cycloisomerase